LLFEARTHRGLVRDHNEDFYLLPDPDADSGPATESDLDADGAAAFFVLCDGMGGTNAGEVAAETAARFLMEGWRASSPDGLPALMKKASDHLYTLSKKHREYRGMGTTAICAAVTVDSVRVCSVGDSRAYRLHRGRLEQLTEDHSLVWQLYREGKIAKDDLRFHPRNNIVTHALGVDGSLRDEDVETVKVPVERGDIILLCSDGLTDMLSDGEVREVLCGTGTLGEKADRLVDAANEAGGRDNITVTLIEL
jgi:PPM family protein phosphatase